MEEMVDPEEQGIACALGKICYLESRLRDAIQSTHSLTRSYGRDSQVVDRERAALLVIREHLEGLEDKLREYKTAVSDPKTNDDKPIALSQMDHYRKELLRHARDRVDEVMYNKDVVKDIMAFADTGAGDEPLLDNVPHDPRDTLQSEPHSPLPRSPSEDEDESAFIGDYAESGAYGPTSTATSPHYAPRREGYPRHLNADDGQENGFPYPMPATTPSMHAAQTKEYMRQAEGRGGGGFNGLPGGKHSGRASQQYPSQQRSSDLGSEMVAASRAARDHGKWGAKPPRNASTRSGYDSLASSRTTFDPSTGNPRQPPSSYMGSVQASNDEPFAQGSRYQMDPSYGGKLTFRGREQGAAQGAQHSVPTSPVALADPPAPRVMNDPSYAEPSPRSEINRAQGEEEEEEDLQTPAVRQAAAPIQANRTALERRAAAQRPQPKPRRSLNPFGGLGALGGGLFHSLAGGLRALGSLPVGALEAAGKVVPTAEQVATCLRLTMTSLLGAGAVVFVASAAKHPQKLMKAVPNPPKRVKAKSKAVTGPQADGHLVPDWMHRSQFKASENPPVGHLTATAGPPRGEMFPVIPPPSSSHVRG